MSRAQRSPSAREYGRCLELVGSVHEVLRSGDTLGARALILDGARAVLGGAAVFWTVLEADQKTSSDPDRTALCGLEDWQIELWKEPFFDQAAYLENPLWETLQHGRGELRTVGRGDVIPEGLWYAHPAHELARALGMGDEIVSMIPVGDQRECMLAVSRRVGERRFGEPEKRLLTSLNGALSSTYRQIVEPLRDGAGRPTVEGLRVRLSPRHRGVFDQLLAGRSEKEAAVRLGLSPRTVHKYVEAVYRSAGVSSRAELMAAFIASPLRRSM